MRAIILLVAILVAGCSVNVPVPETKPLPPAQAAPTVVTPTPKRYTCSMQKKAAAELKALPPGAVLRTFMNDYSLLRDQNRAALGVGDECIPD